MTGWSESSFTTWNTDCIHSQHVDHFMKDMEGKGSEILNSLFGGLWSKVNELPKPFPEKMEKRLTVWDLRISTDLEMPWSTCNLITKSLVCVCW